MLPVPEEPYEYLSGFALISATSSFTFVAFTSVLTTSTFGTTTISATGAMSLNGSYGSFIRWGAIDCAVLVATTIV